MQNELIFTLALSAALTLGLSTPAAAQMSGHDHTMMENKTESKGTGNTINVDNFSFSPATLTVTAGTTVTWTNHDDIPHNIVERDQKFKSKALDTDDSYSHTFAEPGTYEYFCGLHPKMVGKVIVEAKK
jgi:plastocyanin